MSQPIDSEGMGLRATVEACGFTLMPSFPLHYRKVLQGDVVLIDADPWDIWQWLRSTKRIK